MGADNYKHTRVADLYIKGYSITEAYSAIYPTASKATANINGNKIIKEHSIVRYMQEKIDRTRTMGSWDKQEILNRIMTIVEDLESSNTERLKALKLGAELMGYTKKGNTQIQQPEETEEIEEEFNNMTDEDLNKLLAQMQ